MIEEAFVSFDIARRLKEKGFNESIETTINRNGQINHVEDKYRRITIRNSEINIYCDEVSCPTQQMAMRWLREVKGIFIQIIITHNDNYDFRIWKNCEYVNREDFLIEFETYELAVAFGLLFVLTKMEL